MLRIWIHIWIGIQICIRFQILYPDPDENLAENLSIRVSYFDLLCSGFPAYLTGLQQPMYGYTGVGAGLGGQQLEDLAALQRSTLASLPQLVGTAASQLPGPKAVRVTPLYSMLTSVVRRSSHASA